MSSKMPTQREESIRLTEQGFALLLNRLFGLDAWLKIEKPLKKIVLNIEAVRIYLPELKKEVNQTTEHGERPTLYIKKTKREKTGATEFEIVFMGRPSERHVETLRYFKKPLEKWISWGELVLNEEQALKLFEFLKDAITRQHSLARFVR